jgi:diguanylate cyclase (GGDEF)-like protein
LKSLIRNLAIAGSVMGIMACLLVKTKLVDIDEHNRYVNLLLQLQNVDSSLNENLLKARHAYLMNYDPIVENVRDLKAGAEKLQDPPGFIRRASRGDIQVRQQVRELLALVGQKEILVERFKSENSILRNSLSFFPMAAFEMTRTGGGGSGQVYALLRDVLMYNLHSNEDIVPRIQAEMEALSARKGQIVQATSKDDLQRILDHGNAILKYKADLDGITTQALELPTRTLLRGIQATYGEQYSQMVAVTNNYRLVLYLCAILLIAATTYYFLWLKNTTLALNEANLVLERRILERTEDFNQANHELTRQKEQLVLHVEELRSARDKMHRISITDELTGLYTRRFLFEWMEKQVAGFNRSTGRFSCLMLDIDFFKKINDSFGHGAGDDVIRQVANVVRAVARDSDIVGRYGGEEFMVLLPNTSLDNALQMAEKVRAAIENNIKQPRQVTASIGVASLECTEITSQRPNTSETISTLLGRADQTLYRAKENGRNRFEFSPEPILIHDIDLSLPQGGESADFYIERDPQPRCA